MPVVNLSDVPLKTGSSYPGNQAKLMDGRVQQAIGAFAGLSQFGANLVQLAPGAMSSLRHWHEQQDEFLMVTQGTLTLVEDDGETEMSAGEFAAFPAGVANGHHLINKSDAAAAFLVIGTHTATETGHYSDIDMMVHIKDGAFSFTHKDGTPYEGEDK